MKTKLTCYCDEAVCEGFQEDNFRIRTDIDMCERFEEEINILQCEHRNQFNRVILHKTQVPESNV